MTANTDGIGETSREGMPDDSGVLYLPEDVDRLTESVLGDDRTRHVSTAYLPHRGAMIRILERLTWLMFPGFVGPRHLSEESMRDHGEGLLEEISGELVEQVAAALRYARDADADDPSLPELTTRDDCMARAGQIVRVFIRDLPRIRTLLSLDVQAAYDHDPSMHHTDEAVFCYPGVRALTIHRLAHVLYRLNVPLLPRIMAEYAHAETGIDIHPGAVIGRSFFIDHGTGVVIGETTTIGDHCRLYQGVTLGAATFDKDDQGKLLRGTKRHPTLEDHVTVYAGACILGGRTVIGAGCVVNGGVFLTQSVAPGHVVRGPRLDISLRNNPDMPPAGYSI